MKRLLILLALHPLICYPQITITEADIAEQYAISNTVTTYSNYVFLPVNIGSPGGGNNWDFQWFGLNNPVFNTVMSPDDTPFRNQFAQSTHCLYNWFTQEGNVYKNYSYLNLTATDFSLSGDASTFSWIEGSLLKVVNIPPEILFALPLSYGLSWMQNYMSTYTYSVNGNIQNEEISSITINSVVDAWGTITVPGGVTTDALRLKEDKITVNQTTGSYERVIIYTFITKNNGEFTVPVDTTQPDNGEVNVNGVVSWNGNFTTGIDGFKNPPDEYSLKQNYPNPFNPSTKIKFTIPNAGQRDSSPYNVTLKVYDVLGNEVATLINEVKPAGTYEVEFNAEHLPSGMYFAKLTANDFTRVIKMTLLK